MLTPLPKDRGKENTHKGLIEIATGIKEKQVLITITDNGIGMDESIIPTIFDPFFTSKEVGKRTGQGLTLAYSTIVDKHQGSIRSKSLAAGNNG